MVQQRYLGNDDDSELGLGNNQISYGRPEFTPIGSKSSAGLTLSDNNTNGNHNNADEDEDNDTFTNLRTRNQLLNYSELYTDKLNNPRSNPTMTNKKPDTTREWNTNTTQHTLLHRTKFNNKSHNAHDNDDLLNSSSVASSVWEDDLQPNENFGSKLFKKTDITNRGTDVLPNFRDDENDIHESNMIKSQSEMMMKLQSENTNLRVEVLTLRQNLNGLPLNSIELIEQNVVLNQQLVKLRELLEKRDNDESKTTEKRPVDFDEIEDLKEQIEDQKQQLNELHEKYQKVLDEKEDILQEKYEQDSELKKVSVEVQAWDKQREEMLRDKDKIADLEDEVFRLTNELYKVNEQNDSIEKEKESLAAKYEELLNDNNNNSNVKESEIHYQEDINELRTRNLTLEKEKSILKEELDKLTRQNLSSTNQFDEKIKQNYQISRDKISEMTDELSKASNTIDHLEEELHSKDVQIEQLSNNIKELNLTLNSYDRKYEDLTKKNQVLEDRLKSSKDGDTVLNDEIDELYEKIEDYENKIENYDIEINQLENKLRNYEKQIHEFNTSSSDPADSDYLQALEDDKHDLYDSVVKLQQLLKEKELQIERLKEDNVEIDDIIKLQKKIEDEREAYTKELTQLNEQYNSSLDKLLVKNKLLEDSNTKLILEFEELQREYNKLDQSQRDLGLIDDLSSDLAKISLEYKNLEDGNNILIDRLNSEIAALNNIVNEKNEEISRLAHESIDSTTFDHKLDELKSKVIALKEEKHTLQERLVKIEDENSKLKMINDTHESKKTFTETEVNNLKDELQQVSKTVNILRKEVRIKNDKITELELALDKLQHKNQKIRSFVDGLGIDVNEIFSSSMKIQHNLIKQEAREMDDTAHSKQKYNQLVTEYNNMKDTLLSKIKEMKKKEIELNSKLQRFEENIKLKDNYIEILRSENEMKKDISWFPPTPESPSRLSNINKEVVKLENQKELLKLKLAEKNAKISDLKFLIRFSNIELDKKNEMFKKNEQLMKSAGIQGEPVRKKKSLRTYFLFAVALVRFNNRIKDLKERKFKEDRLKRRIEHGI